MLLGLMVAGRIVASSIPLFAQGRGEEPQGEARGPEGGNPAKITEHEGKTVGAVERQPLSFHGTEPEAGLINATPGLVCTAPGSPFPTECPL
jgi:hypothetical protein